MSEQGPVPWFKHWGKESLGSSDLNALSDHEERIWWRLLAVGCGQPERWHINVPREALARLCASTPTKFAAALVTFERRGMVSLESGEVFLVNAQKYQETPEARRKRMQRERDAGVTSHGTGHGQTAGHVTGTVPQNVTGEERREKKDTPVVPIDAPDEDTDIGFRDRYGTLVTNLGGRDLTASNARKFQDIAEDFTQAEIDQAIKQCNHEGLRGWPNDIARFLPKRAAVVPSSPQGRLQTDEEMRAAIMRRMAAKEAAEA